jgi:flagellar basal body-associated protein FliL
MSEETNVPESEGTWSGLKKTIIGTLSTAVLAGGTWVTTTLFNGGDDKEEVKTQQAAPAPIINVNLENNNTNQQKQSGGTNTIIKEKTIVEKPAPAAEPVKPKEEDSW